MNPPQPPGQKPPGRLDAALEARGYTVLFSIGFGQRADGTYTIKIAADPGVRRLTGKTWAVMRDTIIGAIDKLMATPLDDLERE